MNSKMMRDELYDDDYVFNEQEFKEFHIVRSSPNWKIRGACYSLSLNCLGDKNTLMKKVKKFYIKFFFFYKKEINIFN